MQDPFELMDPPTQLHYPFSFVKFAVQLLQVPETLQLSQF
jgi:hypothetical protein